MSWLHTICNIKTIRFHCFQCSHPTPFSFFRSFPSVLSMNVTDVSFRKTFWPSISKCLYKCYNMQGSFLSNFLNFNKNDWIDEILKNVNNINEIFYIFYKTLSEIVDHHLALMKVTRQRALRLKPWKTKKSNILCRKEIILIVLCL